MRRILKAIWPLIPDPCSHIADILSAERQVYRKSVAPPTEGNPEAAFGPVSE